MFAVTHAFTLSSYFLRIVIIPKFTFKKITEMPPVHIIHSLTHENEINQP